MQLRKAIKNDADVVLNIIRSSRNVYLPYAVSPHSLESQRWWVERKLIPSDAVVIAEVCGEDVGVLATSIDKDIGWIDQLYIKPGNTSKGFGTALLNHAFSILPRLIRLWTFQQNDRAIRFYEHHGFTAVKYTNGENNEELCPDILYEYNKPC